MSAACLNLISILCLSRTALSGSESSGVIKRDFGGTITIQCRSSYSNQEFLSLKKGLKRDFEVLYKDGHSKNTIAEKFADRLQVNGEFPSVDILIKNLTSDDTGPYWCDYKWFDSIQMQSMTKEGRGSVLLVVTADASQPCDDLNMKMRTNLVLVSVVISAVLLLAIIVCFLIWIIHKTKTKRTTTKPRRVPNNDVYEEMRGTIRR